MNHEWQWPDFIELSLNAEIGSYQEDSGSRGNPPVADAADDDPGAVEAI